GGKNAALCVLMLGLNAALFGCVGLPQHLASAGSRQIADFRPAAPDLRIPGDTGPTTQTADIPVVPVPLPPLGREPLARPTSTGITPVSTSVVPPTQPPSDALEKPAKAPTPPIVATTPAALPAAAPSNPVQRLQQLAVTKYASTDSYIARLTRREQVN